MSTPAQLRIAARIHFILKHDLGEGINVAAMLSDPREAREVLFVCQASGNTELVTLARQFVTVSKLAKSQAAVDGPQDAVWARNTTGFGVSTQAAELPSTLEASEASNAREPSERSWRSATQWLRRAGNRVAR